MTRQLEAKKEQRETARLNALAKALDYGLAGALEAQGIILIGFAIKYDAFNCLMTIRAEFGGVRNVAFVGSDNIINCILKAQSEARGDRLKWRVDKYHETQT